MDNNKLIERYISEERMAPYLRCHGGDYDRAIFHYRSNIIISESFYPLLAILEVALRNAIDFQLSKHFKDSRWLENAEFVNMVSRFQLDRITEAKTTIISMKKVITPGRITAELSFGFWTSLFDTRFEMSLWKSLRLCFPNCPKQIRKRKTMSSLFNSIRKLRNRIFHHEAISWNISALKKYEAELMKAITWLDSDLPEWVHAMNQVNETIEKYKAIIERQQFHPLP